MLKLSSRFDFVFVTADNSALKEVIAQWHWPTKNVSTVTDMLRR